jgi:hypothetical protein
MTENPQDRWCVASLRRGTTSITLPTCSGVAVARLEFRAQTGSDTVVAITIAASAVVAANIFHLDMTFLRDRSCEDQVSLDPATILPTSSPWDYFRI